MRLALFAALVVLLATPRLDGWWFVAGWAGFFACCAAALCAGERHHPSPPRAHGIEYREVDK